MMSLQESSKRVDGTGPRNPTSTWCTRPTSQRLSMRLYAYHHLGLAQHVVEDAFTRALVRWGRVVTFDARWRGCARSPGRDPMPPDWGRRGPCTHRVSSTTPSRAQTASCCRRPCRGCRRSNLGRWSCFTSPICRSWTHRPVGGCGRSTGRRGCARPRRPGNTTRRSD
jgi:hypothetical protein